MPYATRLFRNPAAFALVIALAVLASATVLRPVQHARAATTTPQFHFDLYEPQKVVYHVTSGGGWFGREHRHLLTVLNNHMNAVGEGFLDVSIVLQGDGLDLLIAARKDANLASAIDRLKAQGARFMICYNTLAARHLDPQNDLYGVKRSDIISAGVAETAKLMAAGYVYLKL